MHLTGKGKGNMPKWKHKNKKGVRPSPHLLEQLQCSIKILSTSNRMRFPRPVHFKKRGVHLHPEFSLQVTQEL